MQRFDLASVNQQLAKVVLDYTPMPMLDLGLELLYKHNDWTVNSNTVGRQKDDRQEVYANIGWGDAKAFRVMLFADVEFAEYDSTHRTCGAPCTSPNPSAPPSGGPPSANFTWTGTDKDHSYLAGLGMDWLPTERWKANSSLTWGKTNGSADFAAQSGTVIAAPGLVPIKNFDNTRTTTFNSRVTYKFSSNWDFTGGYAYQRFRLSDIAFDNYGYVVPAAPATQTSYASGLYAFNNYISNTVYFVATYKCKRGLERAVG